MDQTSHTVPTSERHQPEVKKPHFQQEFRAVKDCHHYHPFLCLMPSSLKRPKTWTVNEKVGGHSSHCIQPLRGLCPPGRLGEITPWELKYCMSGFGHGNLPSRESTEIPRLNTTLIVSYSSGFELVTCPAAPLPQNQFIYSLFAFFPSLFHSHILAYLVNFWISTLELGQTHLLSLFQSPQEHQSLISG